MAEINIKYGDALYFSDVTDEEVTFSKKVIKDIISDGLLGVYVKIEDYIGISGAGFAYHADPCDEFEINEQRIYETIVRVLMDMGATPTE